MAYVWLQLSQSDFLHLSPREFWECCKFKRKQDERKDRLAWETARYIVRPLLAIQVDPKKRGPLQNLFAFPWDDKPGEKVKKEFSPEEDKQQIEEMKRLEKKLKF